MQIEILTIKIKNFNMNVFVLEIYNIFQWNIDFFKCVKTGFSLFGFYIFKNLIILNLFYHNFVLKDKEKKEK